MDSSLQALAQQFEELVGNPCTGDAPGGGDWLPARCRDINVCLEDVLAEQSDETLALAVQRNIFRSASFVQLLPERYQPRLYRWFRRRGTAADLAGDLVQ